MTSLDNCTCPIRTYLTASKGVTVCKLCPKGGTLSRTRMCLRALSHRNKHTQTSAHTMHTHAHTYIHTYTHTDIHTFAHTYTHTHVQVNAKTEI
jgi:hypothetical protein